MIPTPPCSDCKPQDADRGVNFKLKAKGMATPTWAVSESDTTENEEEAKQTNGPKQELRVVLMKY